MNRDCQVRVRAPTARGELSKQHRAEKLSELEEKGGLC